MNKTDYDNLKQWFLDYTDRFLAEPQADSENILLKKQHTLRVCSNIALMTGELTENQQYLALTAALLHDIGRFEQLKRYATFSDLKSEDHASLGVKIIKELQVLSALATQESELLLIAVENHNKAKIAQGLSAQATQLCNLLRDADKLDIWHILIGYYQQGLENSNPTIVHNLPAGNDLSTAIYERLKQQQIIPFAMLESVVDLKVVQMGWIFDINSDQAISLIAKRNYLQKIYQTLPKTPRIEEIDQRLHKYLAARLKGNCSDRH